MKIEKNKKAKGEKLGLLKEYFMLKNINILCYCL